MDKDVTVQTWQFITSDQAHVFCWCSAPLSKVWYIGRSVVARLVELLQTYQTLHVCTRYVVASARHSIALLLHRFTVSDVWYICYYHQGTNFNQP